eukprot:s9591_g2.t1
MLWDMRGIFSSLQFYHLVLQNSFQEIQADLKGVFIFTGISILYHLVLQNSFQEIQADLKGVFIFTGISILYHPVLQNSFEEIQADLKGVFIFTGISVLYHPVLQNSFEEIQADLKGVFIFTGISILYHLVLQNSFEEIQADLKGVFTRAAMLTQMKDKDKTKGEDKSPEAVKPGSTTLPALAEVHPTTSSVDVMDWLEVISTTMQDLSEGVLSGGLV